MKQYWKKGLILEDTTGSKKIYFQFFSFMSHPAHHYLPYLNRKFSLLILLKSSVTSNTKL